MYTHIGKVWPLALTMKRLGCTRLFEIRAAEAPGSAKASSIADMISSGDIAATVYAFLSSN